LLVTVEAPLGRHSEYGLILPPAAYFSPAVKFFNPHAPTDETQNRLPHWRQDGVAYFVTFRLADALPSGLLRELEYERSAWLAHHPRPWNTTIELEYLQRFSRPIDQWLDHAHGECLLRNSAAQAIVEDSLMHFDGVRYRQLEWVIMPNHVHCAFVLLAPWTLGQVLSTWKGFSSRRLNEHFERSGPVWQKDYFDRIIRDQEHLTRVKDYIRRNSVKAKLREGEYRSWSAEQSERE
jgi:putative transposase